MKFAYSNKVISNGRSSIKNIIKRINWANTNEPIIRAQKTWLYGFSDDIPARKGGRMKYTIGTIN